MYPSIKCISIAANTLLKTHTVQAITQALHSDKGKRIYSLRAPWLKDLIVAEEKIIRTTIKPVKVEQISQVVDGKRSHQHSSQVNKLL